MRSEALKINESFTPIDREWEGVGSSVNKKGWTVNTFEYKADDCPKLSFSIYTNPKDEDSVCGMKLTIKGNTISRWEASDDEQETSSENIGELVREFFEAKNKSDFALHLLNRVEDEHQDKKQSDIKRHLSRVLPVSAILTLAMAGYFSSPANRGQFKAEAYSMGGYPAIAVRYADGVFDWARNMNDKTFPDLPSSFLSDPNIAAYDEYLAKKGTLIQVLDSYRPDYQSIERNELQIESRVISRAEYFKNIINDTAELSRSRLGMVDLPNDVIDHIKLTVRDSGVDKDITSSIVQELKLYMLINNIYMTTGELNDYADSIVHSYKSDLNDVDLLKVYIGARIDTYLPYADLMLSLEPVDISLKKLMERKFVDKEFQDLNGSDKLLTLIASATASSYWLTDPTMSDINWFLANFTNNGLTDILGVSASNDVSDEVAISIWDSIYRIVNFHLETSVSDKLFKNKQDTLIGSYAISRDFLIYASKEGHVVASYNELKEINPDSNFMPIMDESGKLVATFDGIDASSIHFAKPGYSLEPGESFVYPAVFEGNNLPSVVLISNEGNTLEVNSGVQPVKFYKNRLLWVVEDDRTETVLIPESIDKLDDITKLLKSKDFKYAYVPSSVMFSSADIDNFDKIDTREYVDFFFGYPSAIILLDNGKQLWLQIESDSNRDIDTIKSIVNGVEVATGSHVVEIVGHDFVQYNRLVDDDFIYTFRQQARVGNLVPYGEPFVFKLDGSDVAK